MDGKDYLKVACRLGIIFLPRQVCYNKEEETHTMPGNAVLPSHQGMIITRNLQEWACLLPQDMPFATAQRLLSWQTQTEDVLSTTELRQLVREHGQIIRQAEEKEVERLLEHPNLTELSPMLVPNSEPRRPAAWPEELNAAVEEALNTENPRPPEGVKKADWERVLEARREEREKSAAELRRLGPEIKPNQVIASTDEVLVRRPEKRRFWELRTARVATSQGYRYLSGTGEVFLKQLWILLLLCLPQYIGGLTFLVDGARWIREFFSKWLTGLPFKEMILDWYHLRKKCYELTSLICRGRKAKAKLLGALMLALWQGNVEAAINHLEGYRGQAKDEAKLDELIGYLRDRQEIIPNYQTRRARRQYIGSGQAEKANDLLVARRQKHQGMHWSLETSDALAALKTLMLNQGWELYWKQRQVLPLVAT